jgi:hypothetical protein
MSKPDLVETVNLVGHPSREAKYKDLLNYLFVVRKTINNQAQPGHVLYSITYKISPAVEGVTTHQTISLVFLHVFESQ